MTTGLDRLVVAEQPDPGAPGDGEVRVVIRANSLNFHDYLAIITDTGNRGRVPLADGAGIVEAIGAGVTDLVVGDHVVSTFWPSWMTGRPPLGTMETVPGDGADGFAQDLVVRPATSFTRAPAGWSHAEAATLPTAGLTAWRALQQGGTKAGDVVLTMGTGGVALFSLQIAKAMGVTVISTSSSDAKLDRLAAMGADHLINYRKVPEWGMRARALTDGRGVDIVVEIGGADTLAQSFQAVRVDGHIALVGVLAGFSGEVPVWQMLARQIRLQGLSVGSREQQKELVRALDAVGIRPMIDSSFPLSNLADGFRHLISGAHFGKIVIDRTG